MSPVTTSWRAAHAINGIDTMAKTFSELCVAAIGFECVGQLENARETLQAAQDLLEWHMIESLPYD